MSRILKSKKETWNKTFYDEVTIYYPHICTLLPNQYLSDPIIAFYYKYLKEDRKLKGEFINPSISFMMTMMNYQDIFEVLGDLIRKLTLSDVIFFPVNDNQDVQYSNGGSHWSLLVYRRNKDTFYHYDSSKQYNAPVAKLWCKKLKHIVGSNSGQLELCVSPQQENACDCGLFVCAVTEVLAEEELCRKETRLLERVTQKNVDKMREFILNLIDEKL